MAAASSSPPDPAASTDDVTFTLTLSQRSWAAAVVDAIVALSAQPWKPSFLCWSRITAYLVEASHMYHGLGRPGGFPYGRIRPGILERLRVASRQPILSSFEESQDSMVEDLWEQIGQFQGDQLSMQIRQGLNMPPEELPDATLADLMRIMMDRDETLEDLNIPVEAPSSMSEWEAAHRASCPPPQR
jgi:hypothetical protein